MRHSGCQSRGHNVKGAVDRIYHPPRDLQWQARVRRKGYPVQIKAFNTRAEAEAWARQIESEIDRPFDAIFLFQRTHYLLTGERTADFTREFQALVSSSNDAIIRACKEEVPVRTTIALDDDLIAKVQAYTGVEEKSALVREAPRKSGRKPTWHQKRTASTAGR